ncbi:MAG: VWA domain-containing protein [Verrucomicrobiaceae bacterium]|nr:MAG: VWA domain-containing protein [Verrucomicrobiaceae bacterium]
MRRLPIYVLLDCSESMIGTGMTGVQAGIGTMIRTLQRNPHALETAWLSFITFDSRAELKTPLQPLDEVQVPKLKVRPGTAFGSALLLLAERMLKEVRRNQPGAKGDFRPMVVLITDGQPSDDWRPALKALHESVPVGNFYAIGAGDDIDFDGLREVTDIVLNLQQTDDQGWAKLFVWISDTLGTASMGTAEGDEKAAMLARLPDSIEKVEEGHWSSGAERGGPPRQLFLYGLCGVKRLPYLMRYGYDPQYGVYHPTAAHKLDRENADFSGRGQSLAPVDSREVDGCPDCPHCGSEGAGSCGNCGAVFCGGARGEDGRSVCPGCGAQLTTRKDGGDGFKIRASEG